MRLAAAWIAEGQHVFFMVEELPLQEQIQMRVYLARQPFAVEGFQTFS